MRIRFVDWFLIILQIIGILVQLYYILSNGDNLDAMAMICLHLVIIIKCLE